jgi:hypothetical protein
MPPTNKIIFFLFLLIILYCNTFSTKEIVHKDILVEIEFLPSFHLAVKLKLYKSGESGYLTFLAIDKRNKDKVISKDSVTLSKSDFNNFAKKIKPLSLLTIFYDTTIFGNDGIRVKAKISQDGQQNNFNSWSPERDNFFDAIFELLYNKLPAQENYVEDIKAYFDYGLPIRIKSKAPYIARIYGMISIDMDEDLQKFFKKVPKRKKAIIDMRNSWGIATAFDFEEFDLPRPNLIWIVPKEKRDYFKQFDIDSTKMVDNLDSAILQAQIFNKR